ncbi:hypothetical protein K3495_g11029 [Podosphaera aphanis]|nr:hypothetical protein K3495_g11029 [Podosphaera aphanis]
MVFGITNVLPDYLSSPPFSPKFIKTTKIFPVNSDRLPIDVESTIQTPAHNLDDDPDATEVESDEEEELLIDNLSEIDLHAIFEALRDRTRLPIRLHKFTEDFIARNKKQFYIDGNLLKEVPSYDVRLTEAIKMHQNFGHVTAGILISELRQLYWHPDMVFISQETIRTCERC